MALQRKNKKMWRKFGEVTITGVDGNSKILAHSQLYRCDKNGHLVLANHYKRKDNKLETYGIIPMTRNGE